MNYAFLIYSKNKHVTWKRFYKSAFVQAYPEIISRNILRRVSGMNTYNSNNFYFCENGTAFFSRSSAYSNPFVQNRLLIRATFAGCVDTLNYRTQSSLKHFMKYLKNAQSRRKIRISCSIESFISEPN
jgi:hypothetical protein